MLLLLTAGLTACGKKDEAKTVTLEAKWRHEKDHITEYNAQNQVVSSSDRDVTWADYWNFKSDGTFELIENNNTYISGTYTRTNDTVDFTLTYQRNSYLPVNLHKTILELTADRLVLRTEQDLTTGRQVSEAYLTR